MTAAIGLLLGLGGAGCGDFHLCTENTHRVTRTGFSRDERWCERPSGERQGLYTAWHVTGGEGKARQGDFQDDQRTGTWRRWDDAGVLRWEGDYRDGLREGLWTHWHPNGQRWKRGVFGVGERDGLWTFWDRDGGVRARVTYVSGAVASEERFSRPAAPHPMRSLAGVRWSFPLDCGVARTPIVSRDLVIAACGSGSSSPARVYAMDLESGREVWQRELPPVRVSTPWSDGESIYLAAGEELIALDTRTGEPWLRHAMEGRAQAFSTVLRSDDTLYYSSHRGLFALDLEPSSLRWRSAIERGPNAPLTLAHDLLLARFWSTPGLQAIDASSGMQRWSFTPEGSSRGSVAVDGELAFFGSRDRRLYALELDTGEQRWAFETGSWIHASPTVSGDLVLAASGDGYLYALERNSGRERWRFHAGGMIEHGVRAVDGVVLLRSRSGPVYALDRRSGSELWRFDTRTPWGSDPVPGPGVVVFASDDGFLTALE